MGHAVRPGPRPEGRDADTDASFERDAPGRQARGRRTRSAVPDHPFQPRRRQGGQHRLDRPRRQDLDRRPDDHRHRPVEHACRRHRRPGAQGLREAGYPTPKVEGMPLCDWVLLDARDAIVHIFRPDVRQFYNLEKIWGADRPGEGRADGETAHLRIALIAVGRLKAGPERELFDRYFARLQGDRPVGRRGRRRPARNRQIARPPARGPARGRSRGHPEGGRPPRRPRRSGRARASPTSADWAADVARERDRGQGVYAVVIGGPDGLSPTCARRAHKVVSFGAMTWPHQLVRVMAAEQLYRALSILSGHPYHRE